MNILLCQIVDRDPTRSSAQAWYATYVCRALANGGNSVWLLAREGTEGRFALDGSGVEIVPFDLVPFRSPAAIVRYFALRGRIRRLMREKNIAVFHLLSSHPSFLFWGPAVASGTLAYTLHNASFRFGEGVSPANLVVEHYLARKSSCIVVGGESERSTAIARFGWLSRTVQKKTVVSHFGPFDYLRRKLAADANEQPNPQPTALFFGRVVPYKGVPVLLEAWKRVECSVSDARLLIVGPGAIRGYVPGSVRGVEIHDHFVPDEDAAVILAQCDVVVMPYLQGSQTTVISIAHSFGKPVICTDTGSFPEVTGEGKGGIIIPTENPGALADALVSLLSDREKARRLGEQGRCYTSKHFSWKSVAETYVNSYLSLCTEG